MSIETQSPAEPFRPQFTLRRMLKWVFVLALVMGIGRWVYVRTYLQSQIVKELRGLDADVQYAWVFQPTLPGHGTWYGNEMVPPGRVVRVVRLPVPFRTDEDARRANQLLRQLPHLADVTAESSIYGHKLANRAERADRQFTTAIAGLRLRGVLCHTHQLSEESISLICNSPSVSAVSFWRESIPSSEQFASICNSTHITYLVVDDGPLTREHMRSLASAEHLRFLRLSWNQLHPSIGHEDLAALGRLPNCDLRLSAHNLSDADLRDCIANLPNLTHLHLVFEAPSDDAVAALAKTPRLRFLSLQDATVSDEAIVSLADSKSLEELMVQGTDVSEAALLQLRRCPKLQRLWAPHQLDRQTLQAGLPGVHVSTMDTSVIQAKLRTERRAERRASAEAARAAAREMPPP
jgi:hypothetical protein